MKDRSLRLLGASLLVAAAALSALACSSDTTNAGEGEGGHAGGGAASSPACPKATPATGQLCAHDGLVCRYLDRGGYCPGASDVSTCQGNWTTVFDALPSCHEIEPCPDTPPTENTGCNADATCSYCVGGSTDRYTCTNEHTWLLSGGSAGCH